MQVSMRQHVDGAWSQVELDRFLDHVGFLEPIRVDTQAEYDFLWSMQLMIGREFLLYRYGQANPSVDLPPTLVKIDIPL